MRIIVYYLVLLVLIALITGFIWQGSSNMTMPQMISVSVLLGIYVVAMSLVGEGKTIDERDLQHRYLSNRYALLAGTVVLSVGVLIQLFTHKLDFWLLGGLIAINLVKIISLIYVNYKH